MRTTSRCIGGALVVAMVAGGIIGCSGGDATSLEGTDAGDVTPAKDAGSTVKTPSNVDASTPPPPVDAGNVTAPEDAGSSSDVDAGAAATSLANLDVIAGLRVPLNATSLEATSYSWTQTSGSALTIENPKTATASVVLPSTLAAGTTLGFEVAYMVNGASHTLPLTVTIHAAKFEDFLPTVNYPNQIINSTGINFNADGLWVISFPNGFPTATMPVSGMASLFGPTGAFIKRTMINGVSDNSNFDPQGRILIADPGLSLVEAFDTSTGTVTTITSKTSTSGSIGGANEPLSDKSGNLLITDNGAMVWRYNATTKTTTPWLDHVLTNPKALSWGPEMNTVYIGVKGGVKRVAINSDGSAGTPQTYFTAADSSCGVDGVTFDEANNMYVACLSNPDHFYVVPYTATGTAQASQTFQNLTSGAITFRFVNPRFGTSAFGDTNLYFANLSFHTVGRVAIGLKTLVQPMAPVVQ